MMGNVRSLFRLFRFEYKPYVQTNLYNYESTYRNKLSLAEEGKCILLLLHLMQELLSMIPSMILVLSVEKKETLKPKSKLCERLAEFHGTDKVCCSRLFSVTPD